MREDSGVVTAQGIAGPRYVKTWRTEAAEECSTGCRSQTAAFSALSRLLGRLIGWR